MNPKYKKLYNHLLKNNIYLQNIENKTFLFKSNRIKWNINEKTVQLNINIEFGELDQINSLLKQFDTEQCTQEIKKIILNQETHKNAQMIFDEKISSILLKADKFSIFKQELIEELILNLNKPSQQKLGFSYKIDTLFNNWFTKHSELDYIKKIEEKLQLSSYENSFPLARKIKRKFKLFLGPTNSGKTYQALEQLKSGNNGLYLGPLRLLAQEGQEALFERGILSNLITGEERNIIPNATHTSSTIEMCDFNHVYDVAVIDEIQMIQDKDRGWAWSAALIGVPAKEIILVGSEESLPYILPIIKKLNEEYEIVHFKRKNKLEITNPLNSFKELEKGDCIVAFSRKATLNLKQEIEAKGKKCSVIYGNLSPEVRRNEANKFKNGESQVLIATDAIGMGLNLPINRLFFSTVSKFDGIEERQLLGTEIKQIAGRSGRFGISDFGQVSSFNSNDNLIINKKLNEKHIIPIDSRIFIAPNLKQLNTICETMGKNDLYTALLFFKEKLIQNDPLYKTANLDNMLSIAQLIRRKKLPLETLYHYSCAPIDINTKETVDLLFKWINTHQENSYISSPEIPKCLHNNGFIDNYNLYEVENFVKTCMVYKWLSYKYPLIYNDVNNVTKLTLKANQYIEKGLSQIQKNSIFKTRRKK